MGFDVGFLVVLLGVLVVGLNVEGLCVGSSVGLLEVGIPVAGFGVGFALGPCVGSDIGLLVIGLLLGIAVGIILGFALGRNVGSDEGLGLGWMIQLGLVDVDAQGMKAHLRSSLISA